MLPALYALLHVLACQDGNDGLTTGDDGTGGEIEIEGCYPTWDETGGEEQEGLVSVCSGTGNGWIRSIVYITGPDPSQNAITRYNCVQPPPGVKPKDVTEQHCIENPIDLEDLGAFSGGEVLNPEVCCTESTKLTALEKACEKDCAHAACQLAVLKLQDAAAAAELAPTKADLLGFADYLATPVEQAECAKKVTLAAPGVMSWVIGEGISDDELGHIESLTLKLQCDVTTVTAQPQVCDHSANTPEASPTQDHDGVNQDGAVTFFGLFGSGSSAVSSARYSVSTPSCGAPPCAFVLTEFDVELDNLSAGSFEFIAPHLELATRAAGWRDGVAVELPVGALRLSVSTAVKINGEYLLGERPFEFEFSNTEPVTATLSEAGAFSIAQAAFNIYGEHALLNTN